jgi:hypothetical protein
MADGQHEASGTLVSNKFYDALKFCALIAFPAFGAAYFTLASIWGLPAAEQVVGTVTVVDTLLGVLLGVAKNQYTNSDARFAGTVTMVPNHEEEATDLHISMKPDALSSEKEITLKVDRPTAL